jgi:hypothetical protein
MKDIKKGAIVMMRIRGFIVVSCIIVMLAVSLVVNAAGTCENCGSTNTFLYCDGWYHSTVGPGYAHTYKNWLGFNVLCLMSEVRYYTDQFCDDCGYSTHYGDAYHVCKMEHLDSKCPYYQYHSVCPY